MNSRPVQPMASLIFRYRCEPPGRQRSDPGVRHGVQLRRQVPVSCAGAGRAQLEPLWVRSLWTVRLAPRGIPVWMQIPGAELTGNLNRLNRKAATQTRNVQIGGTSEGAVRVRGGKNC